MKKTLLLLALFAGSLLSANAADVLTAYVKPGTTNKLSIRLTNPDLKYTAFQLTVNLPEGLTFPTDAEPVLSARQATTHQVKSHMVDNKTMKIVVFSAGEGTKPTVGNELFTGDKGELLTIDVTPATGFYTNNSLGLMKVAEEEEEVNGVLLLSDIEFVGATLGTDNTYVINKYGSKLNVSAVGKLGDTDGNNALTPYDATCVLLDVVENSPTGYIKEAADMDSNDNITPYDATLILLEIVK